MLWIAITFLSLFAAAFVLLPFIRAGKRGDQTDRNAVNIALYEQRLAELESEDLTEGDRQQLTLELKKGLLQDVDQGEPVSTSAIELSPWSTRLLLATAVFVPVLSFVIYADWGLSLGAGSDLAISEALESTHSDPEKLPAVLEQLRIQLDDQPENHEGWYLYGQLSLGLGGFADAAVAFQYLTTVYAEDADMAALYAESLYLREEQQFTPGVRAAIDSALELNPLEVTMLELKGMDAWHSGRGLESLRWLRKALSTHPESSRALLLKETISQLERRLGVKPQDDRPEVVLEVDVSLDEGLDLPKEQTVFVYARAVGEDAGPMPLAITRFTVADLPRSVRLTESMAMMPGMGLADHPLVRIVARISPEGVVEAQPEDYEVRSPVISVADQSRPIRMVISQRISELVTRKASPPE